MALVGAFSAFAESRSSTISAASKDGSVAAVTIFSTSARNSASGVSESTDQSLAASFGQGRIGGGLDIIGLGVSESSATVVVGIKDSASASGTTASTSAKESTSLVGEYASDSGNALVNSKFSQEVIFPVSDSLSKSGASVIDALVDGSKATVKFAVDSTGQVYTFSRDNVVKPVWGMSVQFSTITWQASTTSVNVIVSGESSQSASGSVKDSAQTLWEVLVSASGEVSASAQEFSAAPSQSIGQLLDDASQAVAFVVSNPGQVLVGSSDAVAISFDTASRSGSALASAISKDSGALYASVEVYSAGVSAVSLSQGDKKGKKKKRLATIPFATPKYENYSRLLDR